MCCPIHYNADNGGVSVMFIECMGWRSDHVDEQRGVRLRCYVLECTVDLNLKLYSLSLCCSNTLQCRERLWTNRKYVCISVWFDTMYAVIVSVAI